MRGDASRDSASLQDASNRDAAALDAATEVVADAAGDSTDAASERDDAGTDGGACSSPIPVDSMQAKRAACTFSAGARVAETLGLDEATRKRIPIGHIIVVMKENRSFDHLFGPLHEQVPAVDAIPAGFTNPTANGTGKVAPFRQKSTCIPYDPGHQWSNMHVQVGDGRMDGFVKNAATKSDGSYAMSYYTAAELPFYHWLATTYPLNDRHFASVRSGTFPNRNFLYLGTADGVQSTGSGYPRASTPTLFDALTKAKVTWGVYSDGAYLSSTLGWKDGRENTGTFNAFLKRLDDGTLPQVSFVDAIENVDDDHPTADLQAGEAWVRTIYQRATASTLWPGLAMIWTYDEGGGFFDHVRPPDKACVARPNNPPAGGSGKPDSDFYELGVRVPFVLISPWARAGYTSHLVQEHTAVTRFIEAVFDLPALTARDANSTALLDLFDFECGPAFLRPPPAPAAGKAGCD